MQKAEPRRRLSCIDTLVPGKEARILWGVGWDRVLIWGQHGYSGTYGDPHSGKRQRLLRGWGVP